MSSLTNVGRITMLVALSRLNLAANKLMLVMFAPLDYGRLEPTFPNADVRTARRMFAVLWRLAAGLSVQASANQIMRRFKRGGHYSLHGWERHTTGSWKRELERELEGCTQAFC